MATGEEIEVVRLKTSARGVGSLIKAIEVKGSL